MRDEKGKKMKRERGEAEDKERQTMFHEEAEFVEV